ncbi:MAG: penicillin-binding transpeptidase domain-containing protein, partial [Solirubrobacterales bacterium]
MNSQFAVRVAVLGAGALIAFSIIFFRLWYLEVLSGDDYLVQAQENRTRSITVQAPRGKILDRNEKPLVENRTAPSLQVRPAELPQRTGEANDVLKELAEVSRMKYKRIKREIKEQTAELPASPVTLKRDAPAKLVYHLAERADMFPGVTADEITVRKYPNGNLASHLFGFVSEVNEDQLAQPQYEELNLGDQIGAAGLEAQYDNVLRGRNGAIEVPVDSFGNPRGRSISEIEPERGDDLVLSIDKNIQKVGEQAIAQFGKPAAFVVMNVNDGAVLGMGSFPNFDPSIYTPPVSFDKIEELTEDPADPLFSNATQSGYPTGSTFKLVTGTASLEEDLTTPTEPIADTGVFDYAGRPWKNAGSQPYGSVNTTRALQVSSDIYFYKMGIRSEEARDGAEADENAFAKWATRLGFGSATGIDLPSENAGLVPTPEWRNELFEEATDPKSCGGTDVVFDF